MLHNQTNNLPHSLIWQVAIMKHINIQLLTMINTLPLCNKTPPSHNSWQPISTCVYYRVHTKMYNNDLLQLHGQTASTFQRL